MNFDIPCYIAIEHGYRNSELSHWKMVDVSMIMQQFTRGYIH